jgi:cell division protein FtsI (penicillin-binding protein 3)
LLSLFAGRLVQLQGLDASTYAASASQIGRDTVAITANRGDIVDRDGEPLASTIEAFNVTVDQTQVTNPAAYALQLEGVLDVETNAVQRALTGTSRFGYVAKGVSGATWRQVKALGLPGLYAEPAAARAYPAGAVGGNVVGFIGRDGSGLAGLEQSQDAALAGQDGEATYHYSPGGQRIPTSSGNAVKPPVAGTGLRLTLDRDLQWYAEQALAEAVDEAKADSGVATVMKVDTQEVLAMASTPVVDPNQPGKTDAEDRGNKAVESAYEPGSIFKPLTVAAIIEEGAAAPESVFSVPDHIRRGGETIHDYYDHPEQRMTLAGIVAKSSNVGTLLAAETIDSGAFRGYLEKFGLGSTPDLGLPAETGGILPEDWSDLTHDNIAFGQGVAVSSVQMASAYATIANGGVRVDPVLIAATVGADGEETVAAPGRTTRVVSEETAAKVTSIMEAVMGPDGTGKPALVDGYRVAGKTGTAQRVDPDCGCYRGYTSSFAGFAPADDPQYVVVVSLMNPRNGNSGGRLAGPAFADIMRFALEQGGVAPSGTEAPQLPLFAE